jgi:hypothetical protein
VKGVESGGEVIEEQVLQIGMVLTGEMMNKLKVHFYERHERTKRRNRNKEMKKEIIT